MRQASAPTKTRPVEIDGTLLDEAAALALDIPNVIEAAVRQEIAAERARRWREEHAEAIAANNARIERDGLWCDDYRPF